MLLDPFGHAGRDAVTVNLLFPRVHVITRALTNPLVHRGEAARTVRATLNRAFTHTTDVTGRYPRAHRGETANTGLDVFPRAQSRRDTFLAPLPH